MGNVPKIARKITQNYIELHKITQYHVILQVFTRNYMKVHTH